MDRFSPNGVATSTGYLREHQRSSTINPSEKKSRVWNSLQTVSRGHSIHGRSNERDRERWVVSARNGMHYRGQAQQGGPSSSHPPNPIDQGGCTLHQNGQWVRWYMSSAWSIRFGGRDEDGP